MKKKIPDVIMVGDNIITTKNAECGEGKKGNIICTHPDNENIYGIKFDFNNKFFHKLQYDKKHAGLLNKNRGLWLEVKDFKVIDIEERNKRQFNNIMFKNYTASLKLIPKEIERSKNLIKSCEQTIQERLAYNKTTEEEIKKHKKNVEALEKIKKPEPENYTAIYEKLLKNKNIKDIIVLQDFIIFQTNNLTYHHYDDLIEDFDLGAYYIYIPTDINNEIRIVNYKKQMNQGRYFHPCIRESGYVCMGDSVREMVNNYRKEAQIEFLIYLLINFLKEPNYGTPYMYAHSFRCAQPVTYKYKYLLDYLNHSNWRNNEKWNEAEFVKTMEKEYKKDLVIAERKISNNEIVDSEYLARLKHLIRDYGDGGAISESEDDESGEDQEE